MTKICTICKEKKDLSEFYLIYYRKWDRKYPHTRCKSCEKELHRKYYIANKDKIKKQCKKYVDENREKVWERVRRYRKKCDPKKIKARSLINDYIKSGKIVKPESCEICKEIKKLQAHHDDYNKPLDIKWLCLQCHNQLHRNLK